MSRGLGDVYKRQMENKPDISYRTFMSNMDDELLKSFHVELKEVWE